MVKGHGVVTLPLDAIFDLARDAIPTRPAAKLEFGKMAIEGKFLTIDFKFSDGEERPEE